MTSVFGLLVACGACDAQNARKNSKLSRSYYLLGHDYLAKKKPAMAKAELLRAINYDAENGDAHKLLGTIFFFEGVHAANFIDRHQCITGDAARDQRQEANATFRTAKSHLEKVVNLSKKKKKIESEALNYLANIALHFQRYDEAIELVGRALDNIMYRNRYIALGTRGQAFFKKGDYTQAARDLRQSLFHQPKFCVGRYWLAKIHFARKHYAQAVTELQKVTADKKCPMQEAFQLLGLSYVKQHKREKARVQFQQCVAHNPKSCISQECKRYAN